VSGDKFTKKDDNIFKSQVKSVEKALNILGAFSVEYPRLTFTEISDRLDIPVGSVYRFLSTLCSCGFLEFEKATKKYSLGPKMILLGSVAVESIDLVGIARPFMEEIRKRTNETVSLYVKRGLEKMCVCKIESSHSIRYSSKIGELTYLHGGASGRVLMSTMSPQELDEYERVVGFKKLASLTLLDRTAVEASLEKTRQDGYAISLKERSENSAGIGVPIFDCTKKVAACLNITLPSDRYDQARIPEWVDLLRWAGAEISRKNGY